MVRMHANHTEEINEARAGDIVALAGLDHTVAGETLCDPAQPLTFGQVPGGQAAGEVIPAAAGRMH